MSTAQITDGGPAFPFEEKNDDGSYHHGTPGMSLRDHFAGLALAALIGHEGKDYTNRGAQAVPKLAAFAYEYADAMLAQRAKGGGA